MGIRVWMCMSCEDVLACPPLSVYVSLSLSPSRCLCLAVSVCLCLCLCQSVFLSLSPSRCFSVSVCLSLSLSVSVFVCLSVCRFFFLPSFYFLKIFYSPQLSVSCVVTHKNTTKAWRGLLSSTAFKRPTKGFVARNYYPLRQRNGDAFNAARLQHYS